MSKKPNPLATPRSEMTRAELRADNFFIKLLAMEKVCAELRKRIPDSLSRLERKELAAKMRLMEDLEIEENLKLFKKLPRLKREPFE